MPPRGAWRGSLKGSSDRPTANRLKPVSIDALDEMGLPSKGETRLNNLTKQEVYFAQIRKRLGLVTVANNGESLAQQLCSLLVASPAPAPTKMDIPWSVLFAMRKLREAIVATRRTDQFANDVLCFTIRMGIRAHSVETYQPTLVHLLRTLHPKRPLSPTELAEFITYHVLDLACRKKSLQEAFRILLVSDMADKSCVQQLLSSLANGNWTRFWRAQQRMSGMERVITEYASEDVRTNAVQCLQRTYFTAEEAFIERCLGEEWQETCKRCATWQLEGTSVVIRRIKAR